MGNNVLYFPTISVPGSAWFTRMLLYWDTVGTIIPAEFMHHPEKLGEQTRSLLEAELLTAVIPRMHLYKIPAFDKSFAKYLENLGPELDRRRRSFDSGKTTEVHAEKVGAVEDVMRSFGLCRGCNDPHYSQWYFVERKTASDFMAYLAASLRQTAGTVLRPDYRQEGQLHAVNARFTHARCERGRAYHVTI